MQMKKNEKKQEKWIAPKMKIMPIKEQTLGSSGESWDMFDNTLS